MTPEDVSILICTFGDDRWVDMAHDRALPSTHGQKAREAIHRHEPYQGHTPEHELLALSRNRAAAEADGEWLCFLDADDELAPGYVEAMCAAWTGGAVTEDWAPLLVPYVTYLDARNLAPASGPASLNRNVPIDQLNYAVVGTLIRRPLFLEVGGFRGSLADGTPLTALEDWDLWLRCTRYGAQMVEVPCAVYRVWRSPGSRNADQSLYRAIREEHLRRVREGT